MTPAASPAQPALPEVRLFGRTLRARERDEYGNDESSRTIPAVYQLARVVERLSNKLTNDARHALFFEHNADPELRATKVEIGLRHHEMVRNAVPDPAYFKGAERPDPATYVTAEPDEWIPQPPAP
ncbi:MULTISPECIES: hypothetical protein [Cupriavidus]